MNDIFYKDGVAGMNMQHVRDAHANMSLPSEMSKEFILSMGYLPVVTHPRPEDTDTQKVVPHNRIQGDDYIRGWQYVNKNPVEQAVQDKRNKDKNHRLELKNDNFVKNFISKSPQEVEQFVDQVTDLDDAKVVLKLLAKMILVIARREYD